jgi:hypothetical protein
VTEAVAHRVPKPARALHHILDNRVLEVEIDVDIIGVLIGFVAISQVEFLSKLLEILGVIEEAVAQ